MKAAIVVIDMQNDFFKEDPLKESKDSLVKNINELTQLARNKKIPVIWVQQEHKSDFSDANLRDKKINRRITIAGTEGAKLIEGLNKKDGEMVIKKNRYSAFFNTNLDEIIKKFKLDTLILAGINTHACIRMAAVDAFQRDIEVIIAKECIGSWNPEHHRITLEYLEKNMSIELLSNNELEEVLG